MGNLLNKIFRASQVFRSYPLCHSRPDRSFCYQGRHFGLCARCTTMYLGGLLVMAGVPIWKPISPVVLVAVGVVLLLPGGIDGTTQMFGHRESTNRLRAVTGFLLGGGVVICVYAGISLLLAV
ncbi:DUF2085 domain-containing protein [Haloplanus rubicundus]|uniref:DUF2085 domain-containing protein n=1 Tax=Haloplanus rubicundus TaxID=1547898 RepID=A0A345E8U2_9EURY|nr:DUF2085 domain-containing protein [Haloplanus rubicundus]